MRVLLVMYQRLLGLPTWGRYGVLWLLGAFSALAFPPFAVKPALIPGIVALLWCLRRAQSWWRAFSYGWWFGFGHFMAGLYWISIALLTDPGQYGWMIPFALFGITAVLALYSALTALVTFLLPVGSPARQVVVFACAWVLLEMARSVLLSGFPWNLAGYVWAGSLPMMQLAALTGVWGLSFLAVLAAGIGAALVHSDSEGNVVLATGRPLYLTALLLFAVWAGGGMRLPDTGQYLATDVTLRLVQPNIMQDHKWKPELRFNTLKRHVDLSATALDRPVDILIWPEAAVPYSLSPHSDLVSYITKVISPQGFLLTGALREEGEGDSFRLWNSVFALNREGDILAYYDKVHLVPFGEYIPFRALLPINKITHGTTDFSAGIAPQTLSPALNVPSFGVLICYEAIFPTGIINPQQRPSWLLNVTNDAWFGMSSGPYQHFEMVRMRAIEQGLPLVRAANTGISAIIDAYGQVVTSLPLETEGILDGYLPATLPPTLYSYYGNYIILLTIYGIGLFLFLTEAVKKGNDEGE